MKTVVSIEGNIGSGKSALVAACGLLPFIQAELEPLDEWKSIEFRNESYNLLRSFYKSPRERFLALQTKIAITFAKQYSKTHQPNMIKVCERQLASARCFIQSGDYDPEDLAVLNELHKHLQTTGKLIPDIVIYLVASPGICLKRIQSRGRSEEKDVTLEYLQKVHDAHEQWLMEGSPTSKTVVRFDANKDFPEVLEKVVSYLRDLDEKENDLGVNAVENSCWDE